MKNTRYIYPIIFILFLFMVNCSGGSADITPKNNEPQPDQKLVMDVTKVVVSNFVGFGTQYNQNLYASISATDGITTANVGQLEAKVKALKSQYVRIFFDSKAWPTDPKYTSATADYMDSFIKTVKLAQDAGASTINITFWHTATPEQMPQFADVLNNLIKNQGLTAVNEVTIQNEVNSTSMTTDYYKSCYTSLDQALTSLGIRNQIRFVGGDLVSTNQQTWFSFMGSNMNDLLSGYSCHIYWNDNELSKPVTRLTDVSSIVNNLGAAKKPVTVTEYGVRGGDQIGFPDPGNLTGTTTPISQTTVSALQNALFQINGLNLGFAGFSRWDCYKSKYDNGAQYYSCIGSATDGYPLYPLYSMTYLFTHTSNPGWRVISTTGSSQLGVVTAAMTNSNGSDQTIYAINNKSGLVKFTLSGLNPNYSYNVYSFNNDNKGSLKKEASVTSDNTGLIQYTSNAKSLIAITTLNITLP